MGVITRFLLLLPALLLTGPAAASANLHGRLQVRLDGRVLEASEVRQRFGPVTLELRQGWEVRTAPVDESGRFSLDASGGAWRLDYLLLGEQVQFLEPLRFAVANAETACAGTIEVDLKEPLTAPSQAAVRVEPCAGPDATKPFSKPRRAPPLASLGGYSLWDRMVSFRVGLAEMDGGERLYVAYRMGLWKGNLEPFVRPEVAWVPGGLRGSVAGGVNVLGFVDLSVGASLGTFNSETGVVPAATRFAPFADVGLHSPGIGLSLRTWSVPEDVFSWRATIEVSPVYVLGLLL